MVPGGHLKKVGRRESSFCPEKELFFQQVLAGTTTARGSEGVPYCSGYPERPLLQGGQHRPDIYQAQLSIWKLGCPDKNNPSIF